MKNKFAARLTKLRKSSGMSQKAAAQKLCISQALLSHYEKGIRECGLDFVLKAAKVLGVSTDYLLGATDSLPTDSADAGIYDELGRKPRLYQARNNLQNALDLLYSITARFGNTKMHADLNNMLYSGVYMALHMYFDEKDPANAEKQSLFVLPYDMAVFRALALQSASFERMAYKLREAEDGFTLDKDTLSNDFTANYAAVSGIIETVEKTVAPQTRA